jgi:hypothetical protein
MSRKKVLLTIGALARLADCATTAGWRYRSLPTYRYDSLIYRRCDEC